MSWYGIKAVECSVDCGDLHCSVCGGFVRYEQHGTVLCWSRRLYHALPVSFRSLFWKRKKKRKEKAA